MLTRLPLVALVLVSCAGLDLDVDDPAAPAPAVPAPAVLGMESGLEVAASTDGAAQLVVTNWGLDWLIVEGSGHVVERLPSGSDRYVPGAGAVARSAGRFSSPFDRFAIASDGGAFVALRRSPGPGDSGLGPDDLESTDDVCAFTDQDELLWCRDLDETYLVDDLWIDDLAGAVGVVQHIDRPLEPGWLGLRTEPELHDVQALALDLATGGPAPERLPALLLDRLAEAPSPSSQLTALLAAVQVDPPGLDELLAEALLDPSWPTAVRLRAGLTLARRAYEGRSAPLTREERRAARQLAREAASGPLLHRSTGERLRAALPDADRLSFAAIDEEGRGELRRRARYEPELVDGALRVRSPLAPGAASAAVVLAEAGHRRQSLKLAARADSAPRHLVLLLAAEGATTAETARARLDEAWDLPVLSRLMGAVLQVCADVACVEAVTSAFEEASDERGRPHPVERGPLTWPLESTEPGREWLARIAETGEVLGEPVTQARLDEWTRPSSLRARSLRSGGSAAPARFDRALYGGVEFARHQRFGPLAEPASGEGLLIQAFPEGGGRVDVDGTAHRGMVVAVVNPTAGPLHLPLQDGGLALLQEARDEAGVWRPIERWVRSWCGNSYSSTPLPSGFFVELVVPRYEGPFETELRVVLPVGGGAIVSEPFRGSIDPGQFVAEEE